tara:strand:- start:1378 stop:3048 length:1671 start_codon:yes stop_codon:yes gene_type:complete
MCGIFFFSGNVYDEKIIHNSFESFSHRGPDDSKIINSKTPINYWLGFHRLAINDLSPSGMQPFVNGNVLVVCNGEIYNHTEIVKKHKLKMDSNSDCEVIQKLYLKYRDSDTFGPEDIASILDGVFAFVIIDENKNRMWVGRDPFGVRSLYWSYNNGEIGVASELKGLHKLISKNSKIEFFPPGHVAQIDMNTKNLTQLKRYFKLSLQSYIKDSDYDLCQEKCVGLLKNAVKKRMLSDRKIGAFLSGGLDSSIICSLVAEHFENKKDFHTFSIGMKGSPDLIYAKKVAEHIGSTHHEVLVSSTDLLSMVQPTIKQIETFDTTTIRASTPMFTLAKYIKKEHPDIVVIFSGEGSDEVCGSYMYFHNAPNDISFNTECHRLLNEIDHFDVLRADKSTAGTGLEIRVPFLDKEFINFYLNLQSSWRRPKKYTHISDRKIEKFFLRDSFSKYKKDCIPEDIIWRTKEAFSDGVSSTENNWFECLQSWINTKYLTPDIFDYKIKKYEYWINPETKEQLFYRELFEKYYSHRSMFLFSHLWMPRWSGNINEPSARVLPNYIEN